jgi:hypothetical protein
MTRTRTAGDFATIRARIEELRRERKAVEAAKTVRSDPPARRKSISWPEANPGAGPNRDRRSGPIRWQLGREELS